MYTAFVTAFIQISYQQIELISVGVSITTEGVLTTVRSNIKE
jgi:hypothetical protein